MRHVTGLLGALLLSACGPAGVLAGKVTVEGGSPAGVAVIIYGPQSAATVTGDDGAFSVGNLPDGKYVVRATVRGADVEELSFATTITNAVASPEPILAFKASVAKVTGRVVFADGSGAENLTVTAVGPETRGARTAPDGSFTFDGLKAGAYLVSVEAKDTLEGRVGVGVNASGAVDAGELRLTPVGRVSGSVQFNTMPVEGVPVTVAGTSLTAVTDAMGRFDLVNVPAGARSLHARVGSEPFFRSATAMVTVLRGTNPDVMMTLSDDPPKTGTVNGLVTFRGPRSPRDISVTVPGAGVTATPLANGTFSLTVPVGVWDVYANAPQHPRLLLGRVSISPQQAVVLPGAELSWYRPLWTSSSGPLTSVSTSYNLLETFPWSYVSFNDATSPRAGLLNTVTGDLRVLVLGSPSFFTFSRTGRYFGWAIANTVFIYEIGTGTITTFAGADDVRSFDFSSDEATLFTVRVGFYLTRTPLNAPASVTRFPTTGNATGAPQGSRDRWFVREANDVRLVTPTLDVPQVFTNVSNFGIVPTAWALTNCALSCQMRVLDPTSTSPALLVTGITPAPGSVVNWPESRGDIPCFRGAANFCVRSSDASYYPLPANVTEFRVNEAGDRAIYGFTLAGQRLVREEALPPSASTTNLGTSVNGWNLGWLTPTRAYAIETAGVTKTLHLVKTMGAATTVTTETDIGPQSIYAVPPLLLFPQQSTQKWRVVLGEGPQRTVDVATTEAPSAIGLRNFVAGEPVTKYAGVSFDNVSQYVIDENQAMVRVRSEAVCANGYRSGTVEACIGLRPVGPPAFFIFQTNAVLEYAEAGLGSPALVGSGPTATGLVSLSVDRRSILFGSLAP